MEVEEEEEGGGAKEKSLKCARYPTGLARAGSRSRHDARGRCGRRVAAREVRRGEEGASPGAPREQPAPRGERGL